MLARTHKSSYARTHAHRNNWLKQVMVDAVGAPRGFFLNKPIREGGLSFRRGDRHSFWDYAYRTEGCVFWAGDIGDTESEGEPSSDEEREGEGVQIKHSPAKKRRTT